MSGGRIQIGTSGWDYPHWRGVFYPRTLPEREWLGYYAERFTSVEVNGSFYRIPSAATVGRWAAATPGHFRFALKLWRGITHYRKLKNCDRALGDFFAVAGVLPVRKRGPILVQLPPNQGPDPGKLDGFLKAFRRAAAPSRWRVALEFRNPAWLCEETCHLLNRHRAALCLHDLEDNAPVGTPNDAAFIYIRRHGTGEGYSGRYSTATIRGEAARVRAWAEAGRDVYIYYNNDAGGASVSNALELKGMLIRSARAARLRGRE